MATNLNNVTIVGNITRDPESRFTQTGRQTTTFGVAVNRSWRNQQTQEWEERTSFFNVVTWAQLAENVSSSLQKGMRVVVTGRLEHRSWETEQGDKRSVVEIVAEGHDVDQRVEVLGRGLVVVERHDLLVQHVRIAVLLEGAGRVVVLDAAALVQGHGGAVLLQTHHRQVGIERLVVGEARRCPFRVGEGDPAAVHRVVARLDGVALECVAPLQRLDDRTAIHELVRAMDPAGEGGRDRLLLLGHLQP